MKIVIAGAGDIGFHLAKLLSSENQDITLIDTNQDVLNSADIYLNLKTIRGDSSSVQILERVEVDDADLFIATTTSEKNNLISCILAKKMGAKSTIARVSTSDYLDESQRETFKEIGIDRLISPYRLASQEIGRLLEQAEVTDIFEFEDGAISLAGITLDNNSYYVNRTLKEFVSDQEEEILFNFIAILRGNTTIIPRNHTVLRKNDHIYFLAKSQQLKELTRVLGKQLKKIQRVMIIGGNDLAYQTAKELEKKYDITLVAPEKQTCKKLAERLDRTLIVQADPSNVAILKEEGLEHYDAFVALTKNTETNIITSLMAEEAGVYKTIALVDNLDYTHISQNIGVDTIINMKIVAANNIFRFIRKGQVEAIASIHGIDAEIIEFIVHRNSKLTKKNLKNLHFPKEAMIGAVIRGDETIIPYGEMVLQKEDKVIVFALPDAISKVESLFR
ncbi:Trk system potassium transporter TrkA [Portibacter marinus]|uniref:Trk system potassium transporter TrkA n=1 Tax=Portibacter marinus TaxID=2898660 RepID=UPI001F00720E|nr:Trk system potassium transporter TrkA [Portibacter marinus]